MPPSETQLQGSSGANKVDDVWGSAQAVRPGRRMIIVIIMMFITIIITIQIITV